MTDAFGNPITLNWRYGFSKNENGFTYITIGEAIKITEKDITLKVISKKRSLYGGILEDEKHGTTVNVKTPILFPACT